MGLYGIIKFFFRRSLELTILLVLITLIPNLPPKANISEPYKISPTKPFTGGLQLNQKLDDVQIWHKGDLHGPEAFADYNGELYTSVHGGDIVKLTGNHITPIVKIGNPCKFFYEEEICGRPLGMQFDKNGALFVADPYLGVFKINVKTGEKIQLISPDEEIGGKKSKIFNSLVLSSNGDIYWTDSSTQFSLQDGLFDTFADPSGRLIHYDSKTKKNSILIDHLHFANGVALSDNEEFIIVAETGRNKIHRYYLKGPKKGTKDVFIDGLPGLPDNLKSDGKGGFLVPLVVAVDDDHPQMIQIFGEFPFVRKLICRVFGLIELFFKSVNQVYPNEFSKYSIHAIGNFAMASRLFTPARVSILRLSQNGEVLDSIHTVAKKIGGISEAHIFKDTLYLGSPFNDYIGKIALEKIGWQNLAHTVTKREAPPKVTTTTEKPTTTTSKPPTTTTQKPTTTTQKPTTTSKPVTTTTPRPTTTTAKPTTAAPKVTTTAKPPSKPVQQKTTPPPTQTPKKVPTQQKDQSKTTHPGK